MAQDHLNALPEGHEISGYRFGTVLGAGGYGITYRAIESALGRTVAIKEYLPHSFARREADRIGVAPRTRNDKELFEWGIERFRQEAGTLVKLQHPNIVRVLRYFEANGSAYIVMVFEEGTSLGDVIRRGGPLPSAKLTAIVGPLLAGMDVVHAAGYLHRDIKPDNIYIRADGSPVLLDFGAARQAIGSRSQHLTAIISPGYAPFEQYATASGEQGPWTDIYALGATFYRCVTGNKPPAAIDRIGGKATMPPATEAGQGRYPPALLSAIDRALEIRIEDRPQSIAAWRTLIDGRAPPCPVPPSAEGAATMVAGAMPEISHTPTPEIGPAAARGATLVAGPTSESDLDRRPANAMPAASPRPKRVRASSGQMLQRMKALGALGGTAVGVLLLIILIYLYLASVGGR